MKLLVAGGQMRRAGVTDRDHEPLYREARLVELDTATGTIIPRLTWRSEGPWDAKRVGHCFKGASWDGDRLLLCTEREVLVVDRSFAVVRVISHPWFNDLHDVRRIGERLFVVSTGLDAVLELDGDEVVEVHPLAHTVPGPIDYRAISTKPHAVHPNHVFALDGRTWVTCFHPPEARALGVPPRRIPMDRPVHDGLVVGEHAWFTTIDGRLVQAEPRTGRTRELVLPRDREPLGWCRGLWIEDDVAWVGFSRLRATAARQHLARVRGWLRRDRVASRLPTRIGAFDLSTTAPVGSWPTEDVGMHAVFSILPALGDAHRAAAAGAPCEV